MSSIINATTTAGVTVTGDNSGSLQLATNNGTTAVTIDTSQNVGVGITNPNSFGKLVVKTSSTSEAAGLAVMSSTNDSILTIYNSGSVHNIGATYSSTGSYQPIAFVTSGTERMRLDTSGNLLFNSGYGSVATAYGCRAWVNFNGTGTIAIRASGNVSSITDNGTGNYTVNFTTAMPDVNYAVTSGGWDPGVPMTIYSRPNTVSTAILQVYDNATAVDDANARLVIFR